MKKLSLLFTALVMLMAQGLVSAQGVLTFEKEVHDFGTLTQGIPATYDFVVKNTGNQPVLISQVHASCGCTTPEWTKEPILPGQTSVIKAGYNSASMGAFNKAMTITSNASAESQVIFIKGMVVEKAVTPTATKEELENSPKLTLTSSVFDFGKLEKGQKATAKFTVKNTGKKDLTISGAQTDCRCVVYKMTPANLKPGQSGKLELTYAPQVLQNRIETVALVSNDITGSPSTITLKANVVESLAKKSSVKVNQASVPFK